MEEKYEIIWRVYNLELVIETWENKIYLRSYLLSFKRF